MKKFIVFIHCTKDIYFLSNDKDQPLNSSYETEFVPLVVYRRANSFLEIFNMFLKDKQEIPNPEKLHQPLISELI